MDTFTLRASAAERWEIPILFEDDVLLAIAKPAGLLSSPDRYDKERPNLMSLLHRGIAEQAVWAREHRWAYLANVHRLDADTSGVLLLAKTKEILSQVSGQFVQRRTKKIYLALVQGLPEPAEQEIEKRIAPHPAREGLFVARTREGKEALTRLKVLENFRRYSLIQAEPITGRTHQIRVHLKSIGHSIVADPLYGVGEGLFLSEFKRGYKHSKTVSERPLIGRLALHSERLTILHPLKGEPLQIVAPMPRDFEVALKYLRKFSTARSTP
jgi:RluA family pseudouridine synthase